MPSFDYTVDGEPQHTSEHELKAGQILSNAGLDPTQRYLIELVGKEQKKQDRKSTRLNSSHRL